MEATSILATLEQQCQLGSTPGQMTEPFPSITLQPEKDGLKMALRLRAN